MRLGLMLAFLALPLAGKAISGVKLTDLARNRSRVLAYVTDLSPGADSQALGLKEVALFLGGTVTWSADPKNLVILYHGDRFSLTLGQPWVSINGQRRQFLPEGFRLVQGRPCLGLESVKGLVAALGLKDIALAPANASEVPPSPTPYHSPTPEVIPASEPLVATPEEPEIAPTPKPLPPARMAQKKSEGVKVLVIDPGHGGYDSGAIGGRGRLEKNYCLDIALILRDQLKKSFPGLKIVMTRSRDVFVSLKDRCEIANKAQADLFISIHNNSAPSRASHGTQVFFYDSQSSNKDAEFLARQENANTNYLEITLMDLEKGQIRDQSIQLARDVEGELVQTLKLKGRRLQYAPFYVLAKTKMPAILVEAAFISNPKEAKLLAARAFREEIARAISVGVKKNMERADSD